MGFFGRVYFFGDIGFWGGGVYRMALGMVEFDNGAIMDLGFVNIIIDVEKKCVVQVVVSVMHQISFHCVLRVSRVYIQTPSRNAKASKKACVKEHLTNWHSSSSSSRSPCSRTTLAQPQCPLHDLRRQDQALRHLATLSDPPG